MPGVLNFKQYLKLFVSWTVCSLPHRSALHGSFLAEQGNRVRQVSWVTLMTPGSASRVHAGSL